MKTLSRFHSRTFTFIKYYSASDKINLLDDDHVWKGRKDVIVFQHDGILNVSVASNQTDKMKKLAVAKNSTKFTERPSFLSLSYESKSSQRKLEHFR